MSGAATAGRWADLRTRVFSAIVMLAVGGFAIWQGGVAFAALAVVVTALMIWELAGMVRSGGALILAGLAGASLVAVRLVDSPLILFALLVPSVTGLMIARLHRAIFVSYALAVMVTGFGLIALRDAFGVMLIVWMIAVVVASDVMGYFAGRIIGGPKFWPRISPKKTWSGTAAGWIGAAAVGFGFWMAGQGSAALIWLSPILAFAAQLGDIVESAIKRRVGVKDSSNLIPGHGGFLDRFDALIGATVAVALIAHLAPLPFGGQ